MLFAWLSGSLPGVPRSVIDPSVQRNAWTYWSPGIVETPTTSLASLIQVANPNVPPSVPKSFMPSDLVQRKGCVSTSPAKFDVPVTSPRLFSPPTDSGRNGPAKVPPRVPRSVILPFSHRNGCRVGTPVLGFTMESV